MKKLFKAQIENIIYVMAEDDKQAHEVTRRSLNEEDSYNFNIWVDEIKSPSFCIDVDWIHSIPYGSDDNKTCNKIIEEMKKSEQKIKEEIEDKEADKRQLKFVFYK